MVMAIKKDDTDIETVKMLFQEMLSIFEVLDYITDKSQSYLNYNKGFTVTSTDLSAMNCSETSCTSLHKALASAAASTFLTNEAKATRGEISDDIHDVVGKLLMSVDNDVVTAKEDLAFSVSIATPNHSICKNTEAAVLTNDKTRSILATDTHIIHQTAGCCLNLVLPENVEPCIDETNIDTTISRKPQTNIISSAMMAIDESKRHGNAKEVENALEKSQNSDGFIGLPTPALHHSNSCEGKACTDSNALPSDVLPRNNKGTVSGDVRCTNSEKPDILDPWLRFVSTSQMHCSIVRKDEPNTETMCKVQDEYDSPAYSSLSDYGDLADPSYSTAIDDTSSRPNNALVNTASGQLLLSSKHGRVGEGMMVLWRPWSWRDCPGNGAEPSKPCARPASSNTSLTSAQTSTRTGSEQWNYDALESNGADRETERSSSTFARIQVEPLRPKTNDADLSNKCILNELNPDSFVSIKDGKSSISTMPGEHISTDEQQKPVKIAQKDTKEDLKVDHFKLNNEIKKGDEISIGDDLEDVSSELNTGNQNQELRGNTSQESNQDNHEAPHIDQNGLEPEINRSTELFIGQCDETSNGNDLQEATFKHAAGEQNVFGPTQISQENNKVPQCDKNDLEPEINRSPELYFGECDETSNCNLQEASFKHAAGEQNGFGPAKISHETNQENNKPPKVGKNDSKSEVNCSPELYFEEFDRETFTKQNAANVDELDDLLAKSPCEELSLYSAHEGDRKVTEIEHSPSTEISMDCCLIPASQLRSVPKNDFFQQPIDRKLCGDSPGPRKPVFGKIPIDDVDLDKASNQVGTSPKINADHAALENQELVGAIDEMSCLSPSPIAHSLTKRDFVQAENRMGKVPRIDADPLLSQTAPKFSGDELENPALSQLEIAGVPVADKSSKNINPCAVPDLYNEHRPDNRAMTVADALRQFEPSLPHGVDQEVPDDLLPADGTLLEDRFYSDECAPSKRPRYDESESDDSASQEEFRTNQESDIFGKSCPFNSCVGPLKLERLHPLRTCSRPRRIGLSRKQRVQHLHKKPYGCL